MLISKNIRFKNFNNSIKNLDKISKKLKFILKENLPVINSLRAEYKNSYSKYLIKKYRNNKKFRIIGMGGSILGAQAIYNFLNKKIKKFFCFYNDLDNQIEVPKKEKFLNLIISKSGGTLETIVNFNLLFKKDEKNIFITENRKSEIFNLAQKLKSEIVHHNNFIGGRYSVLSEVGMLPAELMGLNIKKFKQLNNLIKNKIFMKELVKNVESMLFFIKHKKFNSVILNYDNSSADLFKWYQQLTAESLGKKGKGIIPIISSVPKDNHSLMQLYLDGPKKNFFTFFYVNENKNSKILKNKILLNQPYLRNKKLNDIIYAQKVATEKVFIKEKIPFRSFEIIKRDEKSLGELFCFFVLETILLGRLMNIDPFDQPAVELIKKQTKKILI